MTSLNDHPDIAAAMRTGYPRSKTARMRCCPFCGEELTREELIYINETGEAIGCEKCIRARNSEEYFNDNEGESYETL
jgi:hypothetical protein